MRTVFSLLAALGALSTVTALTAFDKATCDTASPSRVLNPLVVSNGEWSCFSFSLGQDDHHLATLDLPEGAEGAVLQVYAWNSGQTGGDAGAADYRWYNDPSGSLGRTWLSVALPQNNPVDLNNLPSTWTTDSATRYGAVRTSFGLSALPGWTSALHEDGVYAFTGSKTLNPGRNIVILEHPSPGAASTVGAFSGSFMWRLVYPSSNAGVDGISATEANSIIVPTAGNDYSPAFGALSLNRAVQVNNLMSPGSSISLQVSEQFARIGWAMRGFQYTASVSQTGLAAGNLSANAWMGNNAMVQGWSGVADANCSTALAPCAQRAAVGQRINANYTLNNPAVYGAAAGNISHDTSTANTDVVTRTWDLPLDFDPIPRWGQLDFTVPSFMQWGANWRDQPSPFLLVTLTVTWVNDYPMLSSLSDATFRNYDSNVNMGHNVQSMNGQTPSRIYRVQTNAMWWRATVRFSGVENLNKPVGVTDEQPGCDPLWEVQSVSDWANPTNSNGFGQSWGAINADLTSFGFDEFQPNSNNRAFGSKRWITNNFWSSPTYGSLMPNVSPTRNVWLLIRISANNDVTATGTVKQCGSNWIRVGSASFSTSGVADQCSAPADCMVDAANNPNKGQETDTANAGINAAARFSSCAIVATVGPEGRRVPTTKCVECLGDNQCEDGQYCHLDNGICSGNPSVYWYNCDAESGKLYGVCIAKSNEVLGRRCRSAFQGDAGSVTTASPISMIGGPTFSWSGSTRPDFGGPNMNRQFVTKGDAANADFAVGGVGACGEWRFWNGTTSADNADNWLSSNNRPRYALWTGVCHRGRCAECYPGDGFSAAGGKACLNGRTFSAMDVDGTVRTFAENTNAGTELGTTAMVILLLIVFWMYMYAEAKRWRAANGKPAMTCCECLCCCDACTKFDGASTTNPAAK